MQQAQHAEPAAVFRNCDSFITTCGYLHRHDECCCLAFTSPLIRIIFAFDESVISCITTVSAPAGTGAPVNILAAVPGNKRMSVCAGGDTLHNRECDLEHCNILEAAQHNHPWHCCPRQARLMVRSNGLRQHPAQSIIKHHRFFINKSNSTAYQVC